MNPTESIALVTGGNKGLGREIARQLAAKGVHVLLGARDSDRGRRAQSELRREGLAVEFVQLDVTDQESVDEAARFIEYEHGRLDILVKTLASRSTGDRRASAIRHPSKGLFRRTYSACCA
jgi:NAD(P)-dependent dehydrogenase (short-subunit alcohol dehydrogenase family)